jgi:ubiquitin-conjugating enzyme E2 J2
MSTPSGRFKPDTRLCLTMSDFHPESWNPLWSVSSILSGLQSFMLESQPTVGSVESSDATKRALAAKSLAHNIANPIFCKLFPHYTQIYAEQQAAEQLKAAAAAASSASAASAASAAIEKTVLHDCAFIFRRVFLRVFHL